jgi:hypothetical protein
MVVADAGCSNAGLSTCLLPAFRKLFSDGAGGGAWERNAVALGRLGRTTPGSLRFVHVSFFTSHFHFALFLYVALESLKPCDYVMEVRRVMGWVTRRCWMAAEQRRVSTESSKVRNHASPMGVSLIV